MAVRKRNIQIKFYVTEEEKQLIDGKLSQLPAKRMGAYLRKMAIDGYIINLDTADIKAFTGELAAIGRNINQIAKRANAGDSLYQADIQEIRERLDEIWQLASQITSTITPTSAATMRFAVPLTGSARSMACPSSFPGRRRARVTLSIRRLEMAPAIR